MTTERLPVEVPEDDCWFGDDPNTVGTAAAQNRVWCIECADWTDQAVAHNTDHRRIAEGDLAGFAARVRAQITDEAAPNQAKPSDVIVVGARMTEDVLVMVRGVEAALVARVRAEEGQRIVEGLDEFVVDDPEIGRDYGFNAALQQARWVITSGFAAGSAVPVATPERQPCICDGAAYHSPKQNAGRMPFIINPLCPVHGAKDAAGLTAAALAGSGRPAHEWAEIVAGTSPVAIPTEPEVACCPHCGQTHEQLHRAVDLDWPCRYGDAECPVLVHPTAKQDGQR